MHCVNDITVSYYFKYAYNNRPATQTHLPLREKNLANMLAKVF